MWYFWALVILCYVAVVIVITRPLWLGKPAGDEHDAVSHDHSAAVTKRTASKDNKNDYKTDNYNSDPVFSYVWRIIIIFVIAGSVFTTAVFVYRDVGADLYPDQPLAYRLNSDFNGKNIIELMQLAELKLRDKPDSVVGWRTLAPLYSRLKLFDRMIVAYRNIIRLEGWRPESGVKLAEALILANKGIVGVEARQNIDRVLQARPNSVIGQFYLGLSLQQASKLSQAAKIYSGLIARLDANNTWRDKAIAALKKIEKAN